MNKHTVHTRALPFLIFLMVGSFLMWIILRKRTLKEECTHYAYDFRFWRNMIIGTIATVLILFSATEAYYDWADAKYIERLEKDYGK